MFKRQGEVLAKPVCLRCSVSRGGVMFIMPFAREVRLAPTKPTRAPVHGGPRVVLMPPTCERLTALPRPLRAAGKRVLLALLASSPRFLPRNRQPCCVPRAGRKLGALYKKPVAIPKVRWRYSFHCRVLPLAVLASHPRTLTSCHARRCGVGLFAEPGETDEEGPCHANGCYFGRDVVMHRFSRR